MIFVGVDWAEAHHDVLVMDESGSVLGRGRFSTGVSGLAQLHALVADQAEEPDQVIVGIEIDRGLLVESPRRRPRRSAKGPPAARYAVLP